MVHEGKQSDSGIQIKLSHENPVAHVVVRLGVSPAHLTFNISDKNTGKAVTPAVGRWAVVDDIFYASNPNQQERGICFPDKDLLVIVQAPSYKGWFYSDPSSPS
jgi:hypothetical protein